MASCLNDLVMTEVEETVADREDLYILKLLETLRTPFALEVITSLRDYRGVFPDVRQEMKENNIAHL